MHGRVLYKRVRYFCILQEYTTNLDNSKCFERGVVMFQAAVVTLFPEMFPGPLAHSVVGRALKNGVWSFKTLNIRDFATDKHRTVDDTPYGGGAGMLLKADVVAAALRSQKSEVRSQGLIPHTVFLAPTGRRLVQADTKRLATQNKPLIILCGHYEGVDERVLEAEVDEVLSIGDYVLSGGETAAMVLLDAVVRLLPGVLGANASLHEESFDVTDEYGNPLVEYPHYTRPAVWEGREVPAVLQNGNHAEIAKWRLEQAKQSTKKVGHPS
jgi:tRNA (guanine37-N1)-methyltransferase